MSECLLRLASMRCDRKNFPEATALAQQALALDDQNTDAMAFLGHLLMKQNKWAEAQAQFKTLRGTHKPLRYVSGLSQIQTHCLPPRS